MTILGKLGDNTYQNCNVDHLVYHQTFLDIRMATYLCCWTPTAISRWSCHLGDNFYGVIGCCLAFCTDWAFLPFNLGSFAFSTVGKLGDVEAYTDCHPETDKRDSRRRLEDCSLSISPYRPGSSACWVDDPS